MYSATHAEQYERLAQSAHLRVHHPGLFRGASAYRDAAQYYREAARLHPDAERRAFYADRARIMSQRAAEWVIREKGLV